MIQKHPIYPQRIRKIEGSFTFIEHRFLQDGFFANLTHHERSLYLFLALASDRRGLSYYSYDKICTLNGISSDDYILARNSLIDKDLIAFDGSLFQVLSLPAKPFDDSPKPLTNAKDMQRHDPATIRGLIEKSVERWKHD